MKTKITYLIGMLAIALIPTLWMSQGCMGNYPSVASVVVTATPSLPSDFVVNFEDSTNNINPKLANTLLTTVLNSNPSNLGGTNSNSGPITVAHNYAGSVTIATYGGSPANTLNYGTSNFIVPNTIQNVNNGSLFALHMFGGLNTTTNGYEADQLFCNFLSGSPPNPYFDMTAFTGVRMDVAFGGDTNPFRFLAFPIDLTTPSSTPGGICSGSCYAHYQVSLPSGSNTGWMPVTYTWSSFTQAFAPLGTPFSSHLNKVLQLSISMGPNSASGGLTTTTDFWLDNVQFLP